MPYKIENPTKETYIFSIIHDDNVMQKFILKPGEYYYGDTIGENYFISDIARNVLVQDIFKSAGEGKLSIKDENGNNVTYKQYKDANPD